jgi:hypothetical protein
MSLREDRDEVGELRKYRDMDVRIRGIVRPMHGRAGMVLSHARQFYGGRPNSNPTPNWRTASTPSKAGLPSTTLTCARRADGAPL